MLTNHHWTPADIAPGRSAACPCEPGACGTQPIVHAVVALAAQSEVVVGINAVPGVADWTQAQIHMRRSRIQSGLEPGCGAAPLAGLPQALARQPVNRLVRHIRSVA
jgi:hypothetical protein